jgi:hypothetical protein
VISAIDKSRVADSMDIAEMLDLSPLQERPALCGINSESRREVTQRLARRVAMRCDAQRRGTLRAATASR